MLMIIMLIRIPIRRMVIIRMLKIIWIMMRILEITLMIYDDDDNGDDNGKDTIDDDEDDHLY